MADSKGTSWQQQYNATEIYTIECRMPDKAAMVGQVGQAIARAGAHVHQIISSGSEERYVLRDITVYVRSKSQLDEALKLIGQIKGVEVRGVRNEVLETHRRGSIEVVSKAPLRSLTDLRMIYTPGVAQACQEIEKDADKAWELTGLCNRVAVVTNGTAVLGLGDIGVAPSLPVMEGKASIFAEFVGISAFPILVDTKDVDAFVEAVVRIAPSFGAIQMEDVAAPACFEIEEKLRARLNIPVVHDDQHGTATIVLAALINALKQTGKEAKKCSAIILGAGAAGMAISKMLLGFGLGDIVVYDSYGAIYRGRTEKMNRYKVQLAEVTNKKNQKGSLAECFKGKDIFIGVARPNMVTKDMIASMGGNPIALPLSNPVGEITVEEALEAGAAVAADGRGINNALAYPALFRGALDVRATEINLQMQLAASRKIAELAPAGSLLPDILDRGVHAVIAKAVAEEWLRQKRGT